MGSFSPTIFSLTTHPTPAIMIKIVVLLSVLCLALSVPLPDDTPASAALLSYALPYNAGFYPYARVPLVYAAPAPLDSGLVYPVAEAYVHDATGDVSDDSYPEAEAYVHDPSGDA